MWSAPEQPGPERDSAYNSHFLLAVNSLFEGMKDWNIDRKLL